MPAYVAKRRNRFYAVIYEGIDPITGRERRSWHPAGTDRGRAIDLASQLAAEQSENLGRRAGPTLGAYLTRDFGGGGAISAIATIRLTAVTLETTLLLTS